MTRQHRDSSERERHLDVAIAGYLRRKRSATPPDRQQWLERYPEFAPELAQFFADEDEIDGMAGQLRADLPPGSPDDQAGGRPIAPDDADVPQSTVTYRVEPPRVSADRYVVKKFHGRGGMGEVWLAEDGQIGRRVALKRLRGERVEQKERFLAEAQITGQLEHPSIVPLHDLGVDEEGRPFYVMKFVHGRTLKDAILEYHSTDPSPKVPREVQQLQLLEGFVDLCHAVAFAHSRGVLHRDLKPSNIMLGQFGETLLIDWGLAKVMDQPEEPGDESYVHVSSSSGSSATQDGSVLGSPAYMAPEVAEGRIAEVDETTDVYLLGATLYEILTGRPPREGSSNLEMLDLARTVSPTAPRKLNRSVTPALEAICLKAMAQRMQDRYRTALEVAEEVQRYLAAEPVSAYRESFPQRTWRWCKRHRRLLKRAAAAAVVVACTVFVLGIVLENRRWREIKQGELEIKQFRRLADEMWYCATSSDPVAEHAPYYDLGKGVRAGQKAFRLAEKWGAGLDQLRLPAEDAKLKKEELKNELYDLHLLMVQARLQTEYARNQIEDLLGLLDRAAEFREPTRSYYRLRAECSELLHKDRRAAEERKEAKNLRTPTTALDHFLLAEHHRTTAARRRDPSDDPWTWGVNRPVLLQAIDGYRLALEKEPKHFWSHLQLGRCMLSLGRNAEAIGAFGACVAVKPESPWGYSARGLALALSDHFEEAQRDFQNAIDRGQDGEFRPAQLNRGVSRWLQKKYDDALADFGEVLGPPEDRRLIEAAYYRGRVYQEQQKYREALKDFGRVADRRPDFRHVYLARAEIHFIEGRHSQGLKDLDTFLQLATGGFPEADAWQVPYHRGRWLRRHLIPNLAEAELQKASGLGGRSAALFFEWGMAQKMLRRSDDALVVFSKGVELWPEDVKLRVERGDTYEKLGDTYEKRGQHDRALDQYDRALDDFREAVRLDPQNKEALSRLAFARAKGKSRPEAEQHAVAALMHGAGDYLVLHSVACVYAELSQSDPAWKQAYLDRAMMVIRRAVDLWKQGGRGQPNELDLIRAEAARGAFGPLLELPEFQELIRQGGPVSSPPRPELPDH